jgi:DNA-binding response OmpR family regulator
VQSSIATAFDLRTAVGQQVHPVLVLANHPNVTSLLSGFVSLSGHLAAAPLDDEAIEAAVARVRPRVAIIDFDHPGASSLRIARRLRLTGARIVLCSTWQRSAEARRRALAMGAFSFSLPITHHDFDLLLKTALLL